MIKIAQLSAQGSKRFQELIESNASPAAVGQLLSETQSTETLDIGHVDETLVFQTRYEFGRYLSDALSAVENRELFSEKFDGMWAWIAAVYFGQLVGSEVRRYEHYLPTRVGTAGSILHRQAPRTAVELVRFHGSNAKFALQKPMHVQGQLLESLTASQVIARSKIFFSVASALYTDASGKVRRGANAKPKSNRLPGETTGMGSIRRLPLALRRLDLTFDVDSLEASQLIALLPREFRHWTSGSPRAKRTKQQSV